MLPLRLIDSLDSRDLYGRSSYNAKMAKSSRTSKSSEISAASSSTSILDFMPSIPIAAVFSFLKDMRGRLRWSEQDLIATLKVTRTDASKILMLLQMQGYVQKTESGEWLTTASGESVSGSKSPRFKPANIEQALSALSARLTDINGEAHSRFKISKAIAFGDFLCGQAKCQAADIGIELRRRVPGKGRDKTEERDFLKQIAAKNRLLHLQPHEEWMSQRSHRRVLAE